MNSAYTDLIADLIEDGDYKSARAALLKKVEEGDGSACAIMGIYLYVEAFPGSSQQEAFKFWKQGAALGDFDCRGLCLLEGAELCYDEEDDTIVLSVKDKQAKEMLKFGSKGNGYIYVFLFPWLFYDCLTLDISEKLILRIIVEGLEVVKRSNESFLLFRVFDILRRFNQLPFSEKDFGRLFKVYRDLLTEEHPEVCYGIAAEIISFFPEFVGREELCKWISYIEEPMPKEYHYLMAVLKDWDGLMNEVIIHSEEVFRQDPNEGLGSSAYGYCLLKGKGVAKDLREAERVLASNTYDHGLVMRAHCRMFVNPDQPDIEGALALLDQLHEDMGVYWDKMLYLLYAESKKALTAPLRQRLEEEMEDAKENEYDTYLLLRGVQLALRPNVDNQKVARCFLDKRTRPHELISIWLIGVHQDFPLDSIEDLIRDDHLDTDLRYHIAFRFVICAILQKDPNVLVEALQWVDRLGGQKYALRNRTLRHLIAIIAESDRKKREPHVKKFLEEYDELKGEGLANYIRVWLEVCHFQTNRKQLKRFVELTLDSHDSYAIICVGHVLMHMNDPEDVQWGGRVEQAGVKISPLYRMDWMIEAVTGGYYTDVLL